MRIVFDCRSVFEGMGGIGRVARCLARELPRAAPDMEFIFLTGARRPEEPLAPGTPNARELAVHAAMIDPLFEQLVLPGLLSELEADLFHGTCFVVPIARGRAKRVATVHDVVFRRHPELVEPGLRGYLDQWTRVSCELADAVVTVSEFSRQEIAALYGRPPDRIEVIPNAVDDRFFQIERRPPQGPPFVLYVGALERKKNVAALVRGFSALVGGAPDLPHHLVLVGGRGGGPSDLEEALAKEGPPIRERVRLLGQVPEETLERLYGAADLFCYLSEYEGFGLPPLEAMAAGVPTIVSDRASLTEVTSGAALVVDPADPLSVARAMEDVLRDRGLRDRLVEEGRRAARRFSWAASAGRLVHLYRTIARPERPPGVGPASASHRQMSGALR